MDARNDLHSAVYNYNWDDGLEPIRRIIDSQDTEYATALLIYWRLGGPWMSDDDPCEVNKEAQQLYKLVESRLISGFYQVGENKYFPIEEEHLTKTQVYQLKKAGTPQQILEPNYCR